MPTNKDIFFKAIFLEPPRICGKRLMPFSVAHDYFLSHLGNPYMVGGKVTSEHLLNAILVCSMTYKEIKAHLNNPSRIKAWLWFLNWRFRNLDIAHESFMVYLSEHYDVPDHFEPYDVSDFDDFAKPPEAPQKYGGPYQYHLVHIMCREYGLSLDDAWNTGLTTARCYYDIWSESTGYDNTIVPVDVGQPLLEKTA
jgi:hypothetical protein